MPPPLPQLDPDPAGWRAGQVGQRLLRHPEARRSQVGGQAAVTPGRSTSRIGYPVPELRAVHVTTAVPLPNRGRPAWTAARFERQLGDARGLVTMARPPKGGPARPPPAPAGGLQVGCGRTFWADSRRELVGQVARSFYMQAISWLDGLQPLVGFCAVPPPTGGRSVRLGGPTMRTTAGVALVTGRLVQCVSLDAAPFGKMRRETGVSRQRQNGQTPWRAISGRSGWLRVHVTAPGVHLSPRVNAADTDDRSDDQLRWGTSRGVDRTASIVIGGEFGDERGAASLSRRASFRLAAGP